MEAETTATANGDPKPEQVAEEPAENEDTEQRDPEEPTEEEEEEFRSDDSDEELTLSVNKANINRAYVRASAKPLGETPAVEDAAANADLYKGAVAAERVPIAMGTVDAGLQEPTVADVVAPGKLDQTGKPMVLSDERFNPELLRLLRDPRRRTAFDMDLTSIESKPWEQPGADPADHFNFELSESAWEAYAEKQLILLESREREKVGDAPLPIAKDDILALKRREAAIAKGIPVDAPRFYEGGGPHSVPFGPGGPPRPPIGFAGPRRGMDPFGGNGATQGGPPAGPPRGLPPRPDVAARAPGPDHFGPRGAVSGETKDAHPSARRSNLPAWMMEQRNARGPPPAGGYPPRGFDPHGALPQSGMPPRGPHSDRFDRAGPPPNGSTEQSGRPKEEDEAADGFVGASSRFEHRPQPDGPAFDNTSNGHGHPLPREFENGSRSRWEERGNERPRSRHDDYRDRDDYRERQQGAAERSRNYDQSRRGFSSRDRGPRYGSEGYDSRR